ncbi:MAG: pseudouridine-5'-phosphate glycosidase [Silicimonas sp.]|nr:pseudouridine-5'-phosphate glycosidase [Silicimonas sp.]
MDIAPDVAQALAAGRPVVALESTIISHGMPYPQNIEIAAKVEAIVRAEGATPATIAILDGRLTVGLSDEALENLGDPDRDDIQKVSRINLAATVAASATGATTVAATMIIAHLAGIRVFATGGIGGVHRGAETSFDISADLHELSQTPVAVICAGAKAILDIPKTLEVLETLGVPVTTFGQDAFPAFWSRHSSTRSPARADSTHQIAREIAMRRTLGLAGGHLIANPIPEADEIPSDVMIPFIEQVTAEADANPDIEGPKVTPFLLQRLFEVTKGRSLDANAALVLNNARLAANIAADLSSLERNR